MSNPEDIGEDDDGSVMLQREKLVYLVELDSTYKSIFGKLKHLDDLHEAEDDLLNLYGGLETLEMYNKNGRFPVEQTWIDTSRDRITRSMPVQKRKVQALKISDTPRRQAILRGLIFKLAELIAENKLIDPTVIKDPRKIVAEIKELEKGE